MTSKDRFVFLDNMKAIAIAMVVAIHALAFSGDISAELKMQIIVVTTIAVPTFFFIDGYLLALSHFSGVRKSYFLSLKKNSYRLLLPWLIFSLGYCALRYVFEYFNLLDDRYVVGRDIEFVVSGLYGSVYAAQMYFLLSLFIIRLLSPFISMIFSSPWLVVSVLLYISFVVIYEYFRNEIYSTLHIDGGQEPITHAVWGLQYYILGFIAFRISAIIDVKFWLLPSGIIFVACYFYSTKEIFQLAYLVLFFAFLKCFCFESKVFSYVGANTMGVYLVHAPLVLKIVTLITEMLVVDPVMLFLVISSATLVLSVIVVCMVRKLGMEKYLFGEMEIQNRK